MKRDGEIFLEELASYPPKTFESRFSKIAGRLGLGLMLNREELTLLRHAAFVATLCNIAFNGLGGCGGKISPSREGTRTRLELRFMLARDAFCATPGWRSLSASEKGPIFRIFFTVLVAEQNLVQ
jgi:hypothetical protein